MFILLTYNNMQYLKLINLNQPFHSVYILQDILCLRLYKFYPQIYLPYPWKEAELTSVKSKSKRNPIGFVAGKACV